MLTRWLALAVMALHLGYLAYLVTGGFLAWRWPRTLALHLVAVTWGVLVIAAQAPCPLTWLQNLLRERGGQGELDSSFIDSYVSDVFYPAEHEVTVRVLVALTIAASWLGLAMRHGRGHPSARRASSFS